MPNLKQQLQQLQSENPPRDLGPADVALLDELHAMGGEPLIIDEPPAERVRVIEGLAARGLITARIWPENRSDGTVLTTYIVSAPGARGA